MSSVIKSLPNVCRQLINNEQIAILYKNKKAKIFRNTPVQ